MIGTCSICSAPLRPSGVESRDLMVQGLETFEVHVCEACNLGVTLPRLNDAEVSSHYEGGYGAHGVSRSRLRQWHRERRTSHAPFDRIEYVAGGRLLDVGCATGQIGRELIKAGWRVSGVDPSREAVETARTSGLDARHGDISAFAADQDGFDVVLPHHSLEHVSDPVDVLRRSRDLVSKRRGQVKGAIEAGDLGVPRLGMQVNRHWRNCMFSTARP